MTKDSELQNPRRSAFAASSEWKVQAGLTKREYFAAAAMTGILASGVDYTFEGVDYTFEGNGINLGKAAVAAADALLEALGESSSL